MKQKLTGDVNKIQIDVNKTVPLCVFVLFKHFVPSFFVNSMRPDVYIFLASNSSE